MTDTIRQDPKLDALIVAVRQQLGEDAVYQANLRASAAAIATTDIASPAWMAAFLVAYETELRHLVRR